MWWVLEIDALVNFALDSPSNSNKCSVSSSSAHNTDQATRQPHRIAACISYKTNPITYCSRLLIRNIQNSLAMQQACSHVRTTPKSMHARQKQTLRSRWQQQAKRLRTKNLLIELASRPRTPKSYYHSSSVALPCCTWTADDDDM